MCSEHTRDNRDTNSFDIRERPVQFELQRTEIQNQVRLSNGYASDRLCTCSRASIIIIITMIIGAFYSKYGHETSNKFWSHTIANTAATR